LFYRVYYPVSGLKGKAIKRIRKVNKTVVFFTDGLLGRLLKAVHFLCRIGTVSAHFLYLFSA
jgi:hypothetical protein